MKIVLTLFFLTYSLFASELTTAMEAMERGDFKTAVKYFKIAAEQGDAVAQQNLAVMYNNGYGVPKNSELASYWFEQASGQNKSVVVIK